MKFIPATFLIILSFSCHVSTAQYLNSIYSAYGIGDVNTREWNAYSSMGGLGIALKSGRTINDLNPASYGGLTNNRYVLEFAATGTSVQYVSQDQDFSAGYFSVKRAAFGMNLFKNLGTVFGLKQYSNVDYKSTATRNITGSTEVLNENITGSGGINTAYIGNGYNIGKHLSLGITAGVMFGSIKKEEEIESGGSVGVNIENDAFYNKPYMNTGLQYQFKTGVYKWIIGASFQPEAKLRKEETYQIKDQSDSVLENGTVQDSKFEYPLQWGAGITLKNKASTFGADFIQQNWSSTDYHGDGFTTTNLQNFSLGYSYTFQRKRYNGIKDGVTLMAGFQKDLSYIIINGKQVSSTIGTLGANFPSKNGLFNYSLGIRVGQRGQVSYPLVKEKFVDLTLNISLSDVFYIGGRKYD